MGEEEKVTILEENMATQPNNERVEGNKQIVREIMASINSGDDSGLLAKLSPNYVRHCQAMPTELQEIQGPEMMVAWLAGNRATFPDYREEIEWLGGEGDFVAWRSRGHGTMRGAMGPFPATGKTMELVIIGVHRFEDGKLAETWTSWDNLAALTQLGLMPSGS
jgi:predicted ester cyclase